MYYGHGSWVVGAVFVGVAVIRMVSSQRRRGRGQPGHPRHPGARSSFNGAYRHDAPAAPPVGHGPSPTGTGTAPGWFTDPFFRHEQRYWSGVEWTEHVSDDGTPGTDQPPPDPGRRPVG